MHKKSSSSIFNKNKYNLSENDSVTNLTLSWNINNLFKIRELRKNIESLEKEIVDLNIEIF